jgi:hypothetical protein
MIYERVITYYNKLVVENKDPDLPPAAQMSLLRAFKLVVEENSRLRGLQLERHEWKKEANERCRGCKGTFRRWRKLPHIWP